MQRKRRREGRKEGKKEGGKEGRSEGSKEGRDELTTTVNWRISLAGAVLAGQVTSVGAAATSALALADRATAGSIRSTALVL